MDLQNHEPPQNKNNDEEYIFYLIVQSRNFARVGPRHLDSGTVEEEGAVTRVRVLSGQFFYWQS